MEEEAPVKGKQSLPSPSQIAANPTAYLPQPQGNGMGQEHGQANQQGPIQGPVQGKEQASIHGDRDPSPSPSEIARNPSAYLPQRQGHEQQHDHDRD
jgi:hypothetical protein